MGASTFQWFISFDDRLYPSMADKIINATQIAGESKAGLTGI